MKKIERYDCFDPRLVEAIAKFIDLCPEAAVAVFKQINRIIVAQYDHSKHTSDLQLLTIEQSKEQQALRDFLQQVSQMQVSKGITTEDIVALWYLFKRSSNAHVLNQDFELN